MSWWFLSDEQVEDVVVELIRHKSSIERAKRKLPHQIWKGAVGVSVDDRYLIPLGVGVAPIACVLRLVRVEAVEDAGVLHPRVGRRLKIYALRDCLKESLELEP
jgi:hypothetical protein